MRSREESTLAQIRETFGTWLPFPDYGPVDAVCAAYLANQLDGPPVWLVLVPRFDYAMEILFALEGLPRVHPGTELSRGSLASGYNAKPPIGLLHQVIDGESHHLVMAELPEALVRDTRLRRHLCEQLGHVFHGRLQHEWGNGTSIDWEGKVGIVTSANEYDAHSFQHALGGGLVLWPCMRPEPGVERRMALANEKQVDRLRSQLKEAMSSLAAGALDDAPEVRMNEPLWQLVADFARVCAKASGHVERDKRTGEVVGSPVHLARPSPLTQLVRGFAVLREAPEPRIEDLMRVLWASLWSIPKSKREVIQTVDLREGFRREKLDRFTGAHERALEELILLSILEPIRSAVGVLHHVPTEDTLRFFDTVQRLCAPISAEFYMDFAH